MSVGVIGGVPMLDLAYDEDVTAGTDMNIVCTGTGDFVEVQGTAEGRVFSRAQLDDLLDLATVGIGRITTFQADVLAPPPAPRSP